MGYSHRDNAQFGRAKWSKTVLLPCWVAQIGLLLGTLGLFSYRLSYTSKTWAEEEDKGNVPMVEFIWEAVNVAFSFISLIITFISIARFIAEVLTPLPLLFGNILNLALASAVLALDVVVYVRFSEKEYSFIGLIMDCALMFFTIIPVFYSIVIYRRLLSYDDYHIPGNVKPYGYTSNDEQEDTAYRSSWLEPPVAYDPTNPSAPAGRHRSLSATSRLSLGFGSRAASPQPSPPIPDPKQRRESYSHKRDTQFDDYVLRRSSGYTKVDVERALNVEFGWEDTNDQRDSLISSGSVPVSQARPRGDSLSTQQASMEASIGRSGSGSTTATTTNSTATLETPNGMVRAHSLNSVPEAHEEEEARNAALVKKKAREDRKAMLKDNGISRSSSGSSRRSVRLIEPVEGLEEIDLDGQRRKRDS
ncbi:hypothetical protein F4804DRAFT_335106 [Jackrogersella minutella]|nr:hypothetical protein F4804DRAFT_335106 [Jackrogersella minutella]